MDLLHEETPAYKLANSGKTALTDVELLALLIAGGETPGAATKAANLARLILTGRTLHELGRRSESDLCDMGCTPAQANRIIAAVEVGRRRHITDLQTRPRITGSRDAFAAIGAALADLHHEEFWLLMLNKANEIVARKRLSTGGTAGTVVDVKLVYRLALECRAAAIVAVHNHPSGNLQPSQADHDLTKKLQRAGTAVELPLLDHLIVSERGYFSFADEGIL